MLHFKHNGYVAGCDEAGRGCLAGPVVSAAVILDTKKSNENIKDSKKLSEKKRKELSDWIKANSISWGIGFVYPEEIDHINILQAAVKAMHLALNQLSLSPDMIIVDGNYFHSFNDIPHQTIVKGDDQYFSIAAASILAKNERDEYMKKLHQSYPHYHWNKNKGYPTKAHRQAIAELGVTDHHRKTFKLLP